MRPTAWAWREHLLQFRVRIPEYLPPEPEVHPLPPPSLSLSNQHNKDIACPAVCFARLVQDKTVPRESIVGGI